MRILPSTDDVELYATGFGKDLLGRDTLGKRLSELLERIEDPLVVAVTGRWGTGKTYFLRRWVGAHTNQNGGTALTVYFDAFAHDYLDDPLVGLLATLAGRVPKNKAGTVKKIKEVAAILVKPTLSIGVAAVTGGLSSAVGGAAGAAISAAGGKGSDAIDEFWQRAEGRHAAMQEFRANLGALTGPDKSGQPRRLIFVVDELDRCRPDYALQVLEVIKHFFAVPRVHFVLGVNLDALKAIVAARYGAGIDSASYLRKFLSLVAELPERIPGDKRASAAVEYARHLARDAGVPEHLVAELYSQLKMVSINNPVSLRDAEQVMSRVSLLPNDVLNIDSPGDWRMIMITLLIASVVRQDLLPAFINCTISDSDLHAFFGDNEGLANVTVDYWKLLRGGGAALAGDDAKRSVRSFGSLDDLVRNTRKGLPAKIWNEWINVFRVAWN